jgi:hypothetical protein
MATLWSIPFRFENNCGTALSLFALFGKRLNSRCGISFDPASGRLIFDYGYPTVQTRRCSELFH